MDGSCETKEMETLLESVEQFVSDEDKIVTYEFLSQTTGIHVNLAKSVLEKYAEKTKKNSNFPIQVVYSVGGYVGKNLKFLLVTDRKLEQAKAKLDKVVYTHVYSVQKGKLASYGLLYNSNFTDLKKSIQQCSGYSAISCPSVRLRTPEEMKLTKVTNEAKKPTEPTKALTLKPAATEAAKTNVKNEEVANKHIADKKESPKEHKTASKPATDKKAAAKPDMSAFFSKHQVKEPSKTEPTEKKKEEIGEKKETIETKRTQASSLKRVARDASSDDDEDEENKVENGTKKSTVVGNNKRFKLADDNDEFEKQKSKSQPAKTKKASAKPTKKGKGTKAAEKKPQRKRIQQISDSESESDGGEDDDVMMSSPELAIIPPAPVLDDDDDVMEATIVEDAMPKKTRKLVSKQFMDEDGYIVTKKEFVTCEVEEDETPTPKVDTGKKNGSPTKKTESKPPAAKRLSPPGKAKQQSIMNFFTRK